MREFFTAKGASNSGMLWTWWTGQMTQDSDCHLYAKPLESRCIKGQIFNEASEPCQHPVPAYS